MLEVSDNSGVGGAERVRDFQALFEFFFLDDGHYLFDWFWFSIRFWAFRELKLGILENTRVNLWYLRERPQGGSFIAGLVALLYRWNQASTSQRGVRVRLCSSCSKNSSNVQVLGIPFNILDIFKLILSLLIGLNLSHLFNLLLQMLLWPCCVLLLSWTSWHIIQEKTVLIRNRFEQLRLQCLIGICHFAVIALLSSSGRYGLVWLLQIIFECAWGHWGSVV